MKYTLKPFVCRNECSEKSKLKKLVPLICLPADTGAQDTNEEFL